MSKRSRTRTGKEKRPAEKTLPLSVIVLLEGRQKELGMVLESLQKIRKPFEKDYEVIFLTRDAGAVTDLIKSGYDTANMTGRGIYKVLDTAGETGIARKIAAGIAGSRRDNILILDPQWLERSFNFDELLHIPPDSVERENAVFLSFREQDIPAEGNGRPPLVLLKRELASYLIAELPSSDKTFWPELRYRMSKLGIQAGSHVISQVSPYGKAATPARRRTGLLQRARFFTDWFFRIPLQEILSSAHSRYSFLSIPGYFRTLFVSFALVIAVLMPLLSLDAGLSGDDEKHYDHAVKVFNYYATGGEDRSALSDPSLKLNYYGQSFDLVTYLVNRIFHIEREYESRHFQIAVVGFLTILYAGLLAVLLSGYRAGFITMLFMFFAPRFLGHSFNNPMDIPFAFGYIFTLYHTFRFLMKLPEFSLRSAVWIGLGIAFTISIRIGGLLLIPFIFMFSGLYAWFHTWKFRRFSRPWFALIRRGLVYLVVISVCAYMISLVPWPYGLQKPFRNPFEALSVMSNISVAIRVLFDGVIHWSNRLPWYYISMNILYTVPVVILAGFVLAVFLLPLYRNRIQPIFIFFLYFVVLFPVAYVVYKESNVYGGWRHLLFIFPSMAVLSGLAYDTLIRRLKPRPLKIVPAIIIAGGIVHPGLHIVRDHPLEYIYYNELMGIDKAYGRFETDYYMNSLRQGTEWLIENVLEDYRINSEDTLKIASNASLSYYLRHYSDVAKPLYTRYYDRGAYDWDYAVYFCNYIDPFQLKNGLWPPDGTIHTIRIKDVPVCAIVKRKSKKDYEAIRLLQQHDLQNAIPMLEEVNREDPRNEYVKLRLAEAYIQVNEIEKAHAVVNECLEIYPDYDKALNLRGVAYLQSGDLGNAANTFLQITGINYRFASAYHNLGIVCIRRNDAASALGYFKKAIEMNSNYKPSYLAIADILTQQGRTQEAQQYLDAADTL